MAARSSLPPANEDQKHEYLFKVIIIGESATGKTSVLKRYINNLFCVPYRTTIAVDFELKNVTTNDGTIVRLQLWDTLGQERFGSLGCVYYKDVVGCIIVFDISRISTFDAVAKWKEDLDSKVQLPNGDRVPCILLANKCDLLHSGSMNNADEMNEYCQEKGFDGWFETSAKQRINIEKSFQYLTNEIMKHTGDELGKIKRHDPISSIKVSDKPSNNEDAYGCCSGKSLLSFSFFVILSLVICLCFNKM